MLTFRMTKCCSLCKIKWLLQSFHGRLYITFCLLRRSLRELSPLSVLKRWDGGTNKRIAFPFDTSEAVWPSPIVFFKFLCLKSSETSNWTRLYEEWITLSRDKIGAFLISIGQRANCIHWIGIYPLDKVIPSLYNWALMIKRSVLNVKGYSRGQSHFSEINVKMAKKKKFATHFVQKYFIRNSRKLA